MEMAFYSESERPVDEIGGKLGAHVSLECGLIVSARRIAFHRSTLLARLERTPAKGAAALRS